MASVIIVQHGKKARGPGDPGLTETGQQQAQLTAKHLAQDARPTVLVSSPLLRARQTANAISQQLGLEVHVDDRLVERINWDGSTSLEAFLEIWARTTDDPTFEPPHGDSSRAAGARLLDALNQYADGTGPVVFVAHGGVTVDLLRTIVGDDGVRARWPEVLGDGVSNCGLTRLTSTADGWIIEYVASVGHLDDRADAPMSTGTAGKDDCDTG